jgi:carbon-monoxide dehydrogenase small subunit
MSQASAAVQNLKFTLNGVPSQCLAPAGRRLVDLLRDDFGLSATRAACGIGRCGACMVLWNGRPINACLLMAWQIGDAEIITAEGLDDLPEARIVKAALTEENAFQCGYCAPGFVVTLTALLREYTQARGTGTPDAPGITNERAMARERPWPDEHDIRRALAGNICRCTGYHSILRGALRAVERLAEQPTTQSSGDPP